jgi:ribose 5-phosphate isomerase A
LITIEILENTYGRYIMNDKQKVAEQAALQIEAGMTIGLGTGSTADYFIEAISQRVQHENLTIKAVASSTASMIKAQQLNLPLVAIEHISQFRCLCGWCR